MSFKDLINKADSRFSTKDPHELAKELLGSQRRGRTRKIGPPRASGLYQACIRKHVIGSTEEISEEQLEDASMTVTLDLIGNAVHERLQNNELYMGAQRMGWWRCRACGASQGFGPPPGSNYEDSGECINCGCAKEAIEYEEHALDLTDPYRVTGHPDMFLRVQISREEHVYRLLEIKTIKGGPGSSQYPGFEALHVPLVAHQWQVQTYLWACSQEGSGLPIKLDDTALIMYVSKQHEKSFPFKVFQHRNDPSLLERVLKKLDLYKTGMENYPDQLPPAFETCYKSEWSSWKPKGCSVSALCKHFWKKEQRNG